MKRGLSILLCFGRSSFHSGRKELGDCTAPARTCFHSRPSWVDFVDHCLSEGLQHLPLVVVEVSVDVVHGAFFHHPQLALSLRDEPCVMTHDDHSCSHRLRVSGAIKKTSTAHHAPVHQILHGKLWPWFVTFDLVWQTYYLLTLTFNMHILKKTLMRLDVRFVCTGVKWLRTHYWINLRN